MRPEYRLFAAIGQEVTEAALREQLVKNLMGAGELTSPALVAAFGKVPRHMLVPAFVDDGGKTIDASHDDWLERVYRDDALIILDDGGRRSSSSMPTIMARCLESLELQPGKTVLEIGTGSGYSAAIMCEMLGSENVASIDIEPELVEAARGRLADCGYYPTLAVSDGWVGFPQRAPYDCIMATCSGPRVPDAWIEQLAPTGVMVVQLRGGRFDHGLAVLRGQPDGTLLGHLHPRGAGFMWMRKPDGSHDLRGLRRDDLRRLIDTMPEPTVRNCRMPAACFRAEDASGMFTITSSAQFLLRLDDPHSWEWFFRRGADGEPPGPAVATDDGSWARVVMREPPIVYQGGPRCLWDLVEANWARFCAFGQPGYDRYVLAVNHDAQTISLAGTDLAWELTR